MYKRIIRPLFFCFDAETIHHFVFKIIKFLNFIPGVSLLTRGLYKVNDDRLKRTVFGLEFENPIGLAAGFDKDAKYQIGDLKNTSSIAIWKSKPYKSLRKAILMNRKEIDICQNCTEGTKVWS